MRQMSIEKCVNASSHPEQEVQSFLRKSDLESLAKLIAENVADNLGHGKNIETGHHRHAPGSKASNIDELLVQEKDVHLVKGPGNSLLIHCRI